MLIYSNSDDSLVRRFDFMVSLDDIVFKMVDGAISWNCVKQTITTFSTIQV